MFKYKQPFIALKPGLIYHSFKLTESSKDLKMLLRDLTCLCQPNNTKSLNYPSSRNFFTRRRYSLHYYLLSESEVYFHDLFIYQTKF